MSFNSFQTFRKALAQEIILFVARNQETGQHFLYWEGGEMVYFKSNDLPLGTTLNNICVYFFVLFLFDFFLLDVL